MRYPSHSFGALCLACAIVLPALAEDDKDEKPAPAKPSESAPSGQAPSNDKWVTVWDVVGTLSKVNGNSISMKVEYIDQAAAAANQQQVLQRLMQYQQQALRSAMSNASGHHHYHRSLARVRTTQPNQKSLVKTKEVDFILADDARVRIGHPPLEFDDKGNPKKYSPDELKDLKGNDKWGYQADANALTPGEVVRVIVARKRATGAKTKDAPPDEPVVKVIMVLKETATAQASPSKPKK